MSKLTPPAPSAQSKPDYSGACRKCSNRRACKAPCFFVEKYLEFKNRSPFEQNNVIFPDSRRTRRESDFEMLESGKPSNGAVRAFSNWQNWIAEFKGGSTPGLHIEQPSPFINGIDISLKQTGIFIDRFFHRMPYKELAEKYDTTVSGVAKLYVNAKDRIKKTVEAMDRVELAKSNGTPLAKMPKSMRVFLLHTVFGLSNGEISRLLGMHHTLVHRFINTVKDRIICSEYDVLDFTDQDREKAEKRLEKMRDARREYEKKRQRIP
jgi:hypothetical protein